MGVEDDHSEERVLGMNAVVELFLKIISLSEVFLAPIFIQFLKPLLVINKDNEDSVR